MDDIHEKKPVRMAINSSLNGCSLEQDGEDFYIVGADSVRKKLGSAEIKTVELTPINSMYGTGTKTVDITLDGYTPIGAGISSYSQWNMVKGKNTSCSCSLSGNTLTVSTGAVWEANAPYFTVKVVVFYIKD